MRKKIGISAAFLGTLIFVAGLMVPGQALSKQKFPEGKWWINANNFKGELVLSPHGGSVFNTPITNVSFNDKTGELHFFRPGSGQKYSGTVTGNQINGTFTQNGRTFGWRAWRENPAVNAPKGFPQGKWWVNANNRKGELYLTPGGGKIFNNPITETTYDKNTRQIRFTRPSSNQHYQGTVTGNEINGTFTQNGKIFAWKAWREK